jgi:hypothetical protein
MSGVIQQTSCETKTRFFLGMNLGCFFLLKETEPFGAGNDSRFPIPDSRLPTPKVGDAGCVLRHFSLPRHTRNIGLMQEV